MGAAHVGEPGKNRPAVVVSRSDLHGGGFGDLVIVVPISSSVAPSPLRPPLSAGEALAVDSVAVCRSIRALAPNRLLRRLGEVSPETLETIGQALDVILDR
jgi:mRNA interferase MazF